MNSYHARIIVCLAENPGSYNACELAKLLTREFAAFETRGSEVYVASKKLAAAGLIGMDSANGSRTRFYGLVTSSRFDVERVG